MVETLPIAIYVILLTYFFTFIVSITTLWEMSEQFLAALWNILIKETLLEIWKLIKRSQLRKSIIFKNRYEKIRKKMDDDRKEGLEISRHSFNKICDVDDEIKNTLRKLGYSCNIQTNSIHDTTLVIII